MFRIAKTASRFPVVSSAAVQLRKLVAGGETPDSAHACIAAVYFAFPIFASKYSRNFRGPIPGGNPVSLARTRPLAASSTSTVG